MRGADPHATEDFRARALTLLCIAGLAGLPQINVELDESLPPNVIRFETPTGVVDWDAHWDGHHLRLRHPRRLRAVRRLGWA